MRAPTYFGLLLVGCIVLFYLSLIWLFARDHWKQFRAKHPDKQVNFSIVDFWTGISGLTPTFLLLQHNGDLGFEDTPLIWIFLLHVGICQLVGMTLGKIEMHTLLNVIILPQWKSSVGIVLGALIGFIVGVFSAYTFPVWIVPAMFAVVYQFSRKSKVT
jgi:hypothetical protein